MKRWNAPDMMNIGQKLFAKIYKKQRYARHNHDAHLLAREIDDWLPNGIHAMINGDVIPHGI